MPQWIIDLVGESLAPIVWVAIVAIAVCLLAMLMIVLAKKAFGGRIGIGSKERAPRLAVMDVARIDEKRRLILVRRDEVEHLVLVGGHNDVLLEGNIRRATATTGAHRDEGQADVPKFEEATPSKLPSRGYVAPIPVPEAKVAVSRPEPQKQPTAPELPPLGETSASAAPLPVPPAPSLAKEAGGQAIGAKPASATDADQPSPKHTAARPAAMRMRATPTLDLRQSAPATKTPVPAPSSPSSETRTSPLPASPGPGRREPVPVPEVQPEPRTSDAERSRAGLRARMNRSQSSELERVQDATAPAIAVDAPDRRDRPRQPLSVRSFATAIQNGRAPAELPQPNQRAAGQSAIPRDRETPAVVSDRQPSPKEPSEGPVPSRVTAPSPEESTIADSEPSLEDFLTAEMDSDFGNNAFFAEEESDRMADGKTSKDESSETRTPGAQGDRPSSHEAPPPVSVSSPSSPPAGGGSPSSSAPQPDLPRQPAAPAEKLTLEEEMERLLGDFNFGDDSDRKPN